MYSKEEQFLELVSKGSYCYKVFATSFLLSLNIQRVWRVSSPLVSLTIRAPWWRRISIQSIHLNMSRFEHGRCIKTCTFILHLPTVSVLLAEMARSYSWAKISKQISPGLGFECQTLDRQSSTLTIRLLRVQLKESGNQFFGEISALLHTLFRLA